MPFKTRLSLERINHCILLKNSSRSNVLISNKKNDVELWYIPIIKFT